MSLAAELHETNDLLRRVASGHKPCRWGVCHPGADCTCSGPGDGVDHSRMAAMSDLAPAAAMLALRTHLRPVPEDYWKLCLRGEVMIVCHCRHGFRMRPGFSECRCGRMFAFTGRRVLVLPADG